VFVCSALASAESGRGLQPAQHAELGLRVTKPVEHHHPHQGLDIDLVAGAPKDPARLTIAPRLSPRHGHDHAFFFPRATSSALVT